MPRVSERQIYDSMFFPGGIEMSTLRELGYYKHHVCVCMCAFLCVWICVHACVHSFQVHIHKCYHFSQDEKWIGLGAWLAQSEERETLDPGIVSSNPTWHVGITYTNKT